MLFDVQCNASLDVTGMAAKRESYSDIYIYEPVWASVRIRFGSLFSSKVVVRGHCLVTLSLTIYETLKWLSSLPILMQESFWW